MALNNQPSTTSGLPSYCYWLGIVGFLLMILPVAIKIKSPETSNLASVGGDILFTIGYVMALHLTAKKIKSENLSRPSALLINICIVFSCLGVASDFFTLGQADSEMGFWDVFNLLCLLMVVVTSIAFLLDAGTRKIGLWMLLTIAVIFIIALLYADGIHHKRVISFVFLYPVFKMFDAFDEYLQKSDDNVVELGDKKE